MTFNPSSMARFAKLLDDDLRLFAPELLVIGAIVAALALRIIPELNRIPARLVALGFLVPALTDLLADLVHSNEMPIYRPAFGGLLHLDLYSTLFRAMLVFFATAAILLGSLTKLPDREDAVDYQTMLLGATLGLMVMVSANHLMTIFLGLEMASVPSYALAGFLKGRKTGSEAALKYVLYGAVASAVALYGISLMVGKFGTADLLLVAKGIVRDYREGTYGLSFAALAFLFAGFAFKLSVVPYHFWLPDVFEGAAEEVGAFLSVASKTAAVGMTGWFLLFLRMGGVSGAGILQQILCFILLLTAALTMTLGNLAALAQTNLKRLLAYSTIAHAGVLTLGSATLTQAGVAANIYYLAGYMPANLAAFAVLALLRDRGIETLDGLKGLHQRSPLLAGALALSFLSLLGLPPLVGFAGKFQIFESLYAAGGTWNAVALGVAVVNTAASAGYYLKAIKIMYLDEGDPTLIPTPRGAGVFFGILLAAIVGLGLIWDPLVDIAHNAVNLFPRPR